MEGAALWEVEEYIGKAINNFANPSLKPIAARWAAPAYLFAMNNM